MFSLSLTMRHECSVCSQTWPDFEAAEAARIKLQLFGMGPGFPVCPCCLQDAQHLMGSARYQARARKHVGWRPEPLPLLSPDRPDPMLSPYPWTDETLGARVLRPPQARFGTQSSREEMVNSA